MLACRGFTCSREVLPRRPDARLHRELVRLAKLPPLDLVLSGPSNTRRRTFETHLLVDRSGLARTLEFDAMLRTLRLISESESAAITPGVTMAGAFATRDFCMDPLVGLVLFPELRSIHSAGKRLNPAVADFLNGLGKASEKVNQSRTALLEERSPHS